MLIINEEFETAVNVMALSNEIKQNVKSDEDAELIKIILLNFYGLNLEGL